MVINYWLCITKCYCIIIQKIEQAYKNIKLPAGTVLKIDGVTIKLVPKL